MTTPDVDDIVTIYEAFGCAPDCSARALPRYPNPHVRPASDKGRVRRYHRHELDALDDDTDVTAVRIVTPDELEIATYGDDTKGAYVHVYAIDPDRAREMFHRIEAALPAFLNAIWTAPR